jgi:hypothetical protein
MSKIDTRIMGPKPKGTSSTGPKGPRPSYAGTSSTGPKGKAPFYQRRPLTTDVVDKEKGGPGNKSDI